MWEILGITATHDIKKIKRAYAKMLTIYHPEDNPEKFMEIQEAYEYAINYAKNANKYNNDLQTEKEQRKIIFKKAAESQEEKTEDLQSAEPKIEQIPDYIKNVTTEKNEELAQKERKAMNQYINKIIDSLSYKKRSEVEKTVQLLNTDEFLDIASKKEFYTDLERELKKIYTGNVAILETLKNIYETMNFLDNKEMNNNIVTFLIERINIVNQINEKNTNNFIGRFLLGIGAIALICLLVVSLFKIKQHGNNEIHEDIPSVNELCLLLKENYGVDIPPEDVYDKEKDKKTNTSIIYYTSNQGDKISFISLFDGNTDSSSEAVFNFENKLCKEYTKKYLVEYINKDITTSVMDIPGMNYVIDDEQINMKFDVTEEQIDSFVDSFYDFKEAYWTEIPVSSRNTEYQFTVHFYYEGVMGYILEHERKDVVIKLSTSNSDIDKEALQKQIRGD